VRATSARFLFDGDSAGSCIGNPEGQQSRNGAVRLRALLDPADHGLTAAEVESQVALVPAEPVSN